MTMRPVLLNSCAMATTAAEARFRIDVPIEGRRGARVVALDDDAATIVRRLALQQWSGARFFTLVAGTPSGGSAPERDGAGDPDEMAREMALHRTNGTDTRLADELAAADVTVMLATAAGSDAAAAASAIGRACARRGIMTAGLVLGDRHEVGDVVAALRPYAQVLLVTSDEQDVHEVLTALRA
jgi:hypothetical protein